MYLFKCLSKKNKREFFCILPQIGLSLNTSADSGKFDRFTEINSRTSGDFIWRKLAAARNRSSTTPLHLNSMIVRTRYSLRFGRNLTNVNQLLGFFTALVHVSKPHRSEPDYKTTIKQKKKLGEISRKFLVLPSQGIKYTDVFQL